ncbi:MAG: rhodanese-like domain-containing protein [Nitrospirota bacterium]|nr:rhodanese-like domain-containing protein [Nitrospirota bacterium]
MASNAAIGAGHPHPHRPGRFGHLVTVLRWALVALVLLVLLTMLLPPGIHGMGSISATELNSRLGAGVAGTGGTTGISNHISNISGRADVPLVLDVRTGPEFRSGHIAGALGVPLHMVPFRLGTLSALNGREVVVVCLSGHRSRVAGLLLRLAGFSRLENLDGGMAGWIAKGLPSVS